MAWTDPPVWTKNHTVTSALLNTYVRDNLNYLYLVTAVQTADVTKNANTTFADLTGLAFTVASGEVWVFAAVSFTSGAAAADVKYTVTAPATTTGRFGLAGSGIPITAGSTTTFGGAVAMTVSDTVTQVCITGKLTAGGAGTVQIQGAQNTSDASDTVFYSSSFLVAMRVT